MNHDSDTNMNRRKQRHASTLVLSLRREKPTSVTKWIKQSLSDLSLLDESSNGKNGTAQTLGGKRWKWVHHRHLSALERKLRSNPMLPFECVEQKSFELLRELLNEHPSIVNYRDQKGSQLLHYAVASTDCLDLVKLLVEYGADIYSPDGKGNLPSHLCVMFGNMPVFQYFVKLGVSMTRKNRDGLEPIHLAAQKDQLEFLQTLLTLPDVDKESRGEGGSTPVHYCCVHNSARCLLLLIDQGAQIYTPNDHESYPIHAALENSSHRCLYLLFEEEKQQSHDSVDRHNSEASVHGEMVDVKKYIARKSRHSSIYSADLDHLVHCQSPSIRRLVNLKDSEGDTPLHTAVRAGDLEGMKLCLEHGADLLARQNDEATPIHYACTKSDFQAVRLMLEARPELNKIVLNMKNKSGYTPLHLAVLYDHVILVDYLVEKGSQLEQKDCCGLTVLLLAAKQGSYRSATRLVELGSDVTARDVNDRTIAHLMVLHGESGARTLLRICDKANVSPKLLFEKDTSGCTPLHYASQCGDRFGVQGLIERGASVLAKNTEGDTALHIAASYGHLKVVEILLESDEGIRALYQEDCLGRLPIHRAVTQGYSDITELLLEKGGIFRKCHAGNTPLHLAAQYGQLETCKVLLKLSPALLNETNFEGKTALHFAASADKADVVDFLLTSGAEFMPSDNGIYFITEAMECKNYNSLKVIIMHPRWTEIRDLLNGTTQCVIDGLIRTVPSLCSLVMSRGIVTEKDETSGEIKITYDFSVFEKCQNANNPVPIEPMHRAKLMANLQRRDLLFHPLCQAYLDMKWNAYGRLIHIFQFAYFLAIMIIVTIYVVKDDVGIGSGVKLEGEQSYQTSVHAKAHFKRAFHWTMIVIITFHGTLKLIQLKRLGMEYFHDWTNSLVMLTVALSDTLFIDACVGRLLPCWNVIAAMCMFLTWFTFMLQSIRFKFVGIFIVMFLQVFGTVVKCLSVFSIVVIAFGFVFHVLFRDPVEMKAQYMFNHWNTNSTSSMQLPDPTDEREQYNNLGVSLFKTVMMMFGEYEHSRTLIHPLMTSTLEERLNAAMMFLFYLAFLLFVPIILMNLLIGLSVGDIEEVRKSACHQMIMQQIYWLADLETKIPKKLLNKLTKDKISITKKLDKEHSKRLVSSDEMNNTKSQVEMRLEKLENAITRQDLCIRNLIGKLERLITLNEKCATPIRSSTEDTENVKT